MNWVGKVISLHVARDPGEPLSSETSVRLIAGRGVEGDRYYTTRGTFSKKGNKIRHVTLIESEALVAALRDHGVTLAAAESRRNIVTQGVPLNHLVGEAFVVGAVELRGLELCEPCTHLESLTREGVRKALIHRGGLRAEILTTGVIQVGDPVGTPPAT